jgi:hypothetical protein
MGYPDKRPKLMFFRANPVLQLFCRYISLAEACLLVIFSPGLAKADQGTLYKLQQAATNNSQVIMIDWLKEVAKPLCLSQVPMPWPDVKNDLFIDKDGIGDVTNHVFVPMHAVAAWTLNEPSGTNQSIFFDDGSFGNHYTAIEYYPKIPFDYKLLQDVRHAYPRPFLIKTVIILLYGWNPGSPLPENGTFSIRSFLKKMPALPPKSYLSADDGVLNVYPIIKPNAGPSPICSHSH